MSDPVQPQRWQPTRLHHPWDSPGKNTGVGCRFLLQCMKVKSEKEVAQSCPTLSDPIDCSLPGSYVHRIFQARVLEWGAIAFSVFKAYTSSNKVSSLAFVFTIPRGYRIQWQDGILKGVNNYRITNDIHVQKGGVMKCIMMFRTLLMTAAFTF